jgi:hypothetical protein
MGGVSNDSFSNEPATERPAYERSFLSPGGEYLLSLATNLRPEEGSVQVKLTGSLTELPTEPGTCRSSARSGMLPSSKVDSHGSD